jgi:hypothetical protein
MRVMLSLDHASALVSNFLIMLVSSTQLLETIRGIQNLSTVTSERLGICCDFHYHLSRELGSAACRLTESTVIGTAII